VTVPGAPPLELLAPPSPRGVVVPPPLAVGSSSLHAAIAPIERPTSKPARILDDMVIPMRISPFSRSNARRIGMLRSLLVLAACSLVIACNTGPKDAMP
jgi:hypothetical protein